MRADPIELLILWWRAEQHWRPVQGFPSECPSCAGWRTSRQYDDANGTLDADLTTKLANHVGDIVRSIDEPYRSALYELARNRATGTSVWRSARLPTDRNERAVVIRQALDLFEREMV